ncbi:MAG: hypothetical protein Q8R90_02505 [Bacteroidales bacterium]|nr:hypothetical protein [Bacteroidales bacterium]
MITLNFNNFGGGSVTLKDYQSKGICVLNGKIAVDPTNSAYIAATRLELDLPSNFAMIKSAISTAILVSNAPIYRYGTVLHCWIENNKLCIEKLTEWDSYGNYEIYINSAFVTRGYRGDFTQTSNKSLSILNPDNLFMFKHYAYVETVDYVFFVAVFDSFPLSIADGQGPFTLQLSDFATDVNVEIPLIVNDDMYSNTMGTKITVGTFENGNLTFSYPDNTSRIGGSRSFFNFFAVRN